MATNRKSTLWGLVIGTIFALLAAGAAQAEEREEFHKTYTLTADGRVSLKNINGSVTVTAWDRNEVQVDAVKRARDRQRLDEARIEVTAEANSVDVRTRYPEHEGSYNNPAKIDYTLKVPRRALLDKIETINGNVTVEGVQGEVRANSINGSTVGRDLGSAVKLSSINGEVKALVSRISNADAIRLDCVNGAVELTLPSDASADVKASTVHGGINNDFNIPVQKGRFVGSALEARLGSGSASVKLSNVNGGIRILHASDGKPLSKVTNLLPEDRHFD
ncbi:MAG TPA: DUF4097 family beta strand repeat-containing protein [Clostridia bacterium]|nr:DUF4097 family beta strand repeat-containing protein [Clostridia bacterium]